MQLDEKQTQIVNLKEGRYIVYAAAGGGKTFCIEQRVKQLIEDGVNPSSILCITFTSAAAQEMSIRIAHPEVHCSTIHSLMLKILKAECRRLFPKFYPVKVLSPAKQHIMFTKCLAEVFDSDVEARAVKLIIEQAANKMMGSTSDSEIDDVWDLYQDAKLKDGSIDFTDMLTMGLECLKANQSKYQKKYKWLFLDESQDTSIIQLEAVKLLDTGNTFMVGSVEQCVAEGELVSCLEMDFGKGFKIVKKPIEEVNVGQLIASATTGTVLTKAVVTGKANRDAKSIYLMTTESGHSIKVTGEHKMFTYAPTDLTGYFVYLMHHNHYSWRIGYTKDPRMRVRHECCDSLLLLGSFTSETEARYHEMLWSLKYSIPTVLHRDTQYWTKEYIDRLYTDITPNVEKLSQDLDKDVTYPTYTKWSTSKTTNRIRNTIYLNICDLDRKTNRIRGKKYWSWEMPEISHNVSLANSDTKTLDILSKEGFQLNTVRTNKDHPSRPPRYILKYNCSNYIEASKFANRLSTTINGQIVEQIHRLATYNNYARAGIVTPAKNLLPGMCLPVANGHLLNWEKIASIKKIEQPIRVYDLSIDTTVNFVVNDIVVHNCLYNWRCASPNLILNIDQTYPDIQKFYLDTNYRSGDSIISIANNLIMDSKYKTLLMTGTNKPSKVEYLGHFSNISEEVDAICGKVNSNEETMILYRTNWYSMAVELGLKLHGLKYEFISGSSFFDFSEIQDMICFCKLAANQEDIEAFSRVFNKPNKYLGHKWKASFDREYQQIKSIKAALNTNYQDANSRERAYWKKSQIELLGVLGILEHLTRPEEIINVVRRQLGDNQYWLKQCQSDDDEQALSRLDEIEDAASQYTDLVSFLESAKGNYSSASAGILGGITNNDCNIRLGTGHSSKGLEANTVFIVGLMDGLLPHYRSDDMEEERRILYVMLTRARSKLFISSCWHRQWEKPSQFLYQLKGDVHIASH